MLVLAAGCDVFLLHCCCTSAVVLLLPGSALVTVMFLGGFIPRLLWKISTIGTLISLITDAAAPAATAVGAAALSATVVGAAALAAAAIVR